MNDEEQAQVQDSAEDPIVYDDSSDQGEVTGPEAESGEEPIVYEEDEAPSDEGDLSPDGAAAPDEGGLEEAAPGGRVFTALKSTTTRTEAVAALDGPLELDADGGATPAQGLPRRQFQPLKAKSTRTETPTGPGTLVVDGAGEDGAEGSATAALDGDARRALAELKGEVESLRSRNQVLRTERTSIAGRKYALEVVLESLREKLEALEELCRDLDAPGELGDALREIREMIGDARRVAENREVREGELEAERAERLEQLQQLEAKVSDLNERVMGYRAERDGLRGQLDEVMRERGGHLQRIARLEGELEQGSSGQAAADARAATAESELAELRAEAAALRAQLEQTEGDLRTARHELDQAAARVAEAEEHMERLREDSQVHRLNLAELERTAQVSVAEHREGLEAAQAEHARALEAAREAHEAELKGARAAEEELRSTLEAARRELEELADLRTKVEKKDATLAEMKTALVEIRPVLDELDRENRRLSRLVGEARERGRVDIQELLAREQLLRKLEKLTSTDGEA